MGAQSLVPQIRFSLKQCMMRTFTNSMVKHNFKGCTLKHFKNIENYFGPSLFADTKESLNSALFTLKRTTPDFLYLFNETTADEIFKTVISSNSVKNRIIFEANPGFGFITKRLLSSNVSCVKVFETDSYFQSILKKLDNVHPHCLELYDTDFLNIKKIISNNKYNSGSGFEGIMKGLLPAQWSDEPPYTIIASLPDEQFLKYLNLIIVYQSSLITYGRPQMYLLVDPYLFLNLTGSFIKPFTILSRFFYDIELLGQFSRKDYLPWTAGPTKRKMISIYKDLDLSQIYLIKVVPKKDLLENIGGVHNLIPLWFFVCQITKVGSTRVISQIEKWVPGCGYRLIARKINVFTHFQDLTHEQVLQVFFDFVSWPEFKNSAFIFAMETFISKFANPVEYSEMEIEKPSSSDESDKKRRKKPGAM